MTLVLMGIAAVVVVLVVFFVFTGIKAEGSMGGEDMIKNVYILGAIRYFNDDHRWKRRSFYGGCGYYRPCALSPNL